MSSSSGIRTTRRELTLGALSAALGLPAFLGPAAAAAQPVAGDALPLHAVRNAAPVNPSSNFHIVGSTVDALPLAEWETKGPMGKGVQIVWGQAAVDQASASASRYQQKTYSFPTGTIRVLEFSASGGGMIHAITSETAIFMLRGSGSVEVAGANVNLDPGDAVNYPSGVLRGSGPATVIAWTVTGTLNNEASRSCILRRADAVVMDSAEWDQGGKRVSARNPAELAAAPVDAIRLSVSRYEFPGNSVRVARNFKGGPTSAKTSELDALIYITSGHMKFTQDGREVEVVAGDAIREIAGASHFWYRLEDSSFLATSSLPVVPLSRGARK
jgi:quercetin dioxygenase-like cupin family protein